MIFSFGSGGPVSSPDILWSPERGKRFMRSALFFDSRKAAARHGRISESGGGLLVRRGAA
ncbi:hypothetical protein CU048_00355 [Beijerinckiaceae bacterium]|nr:hypothetical protein CU048_00355 [Beijerinckiaceae bacterium]